MKDSGPIKVGHALTYFYGSDKSDIRVARSASRCWRSADRRCYAAALPTVAASCLGLGSAQDPDKTVRRRETYRNNRQHDSGTQQWRVHPQHHQLRIHDERVYTSMQLNE